MRSNPNYYKPTEQKAALELAHKHNLHISDINCEIIVDNQIELLTQICLYNDTTKKEVWTQLTYPLDKKELIEIIDELQDERKCYIIGTLDGILATFHEIDLYHKIIFVDLIIHFDVDRNT